jgi:hypothetical protein
MGYTAKEIVELPTDKTEIVTKALRFTASGYNVTIDTDLPYIPLRFIGAVSGNSTPVEWENNTVTYPSEFQQLRAFCNAGYSKYNDHTGAIGAIQNSNPVASVLSRPSNDQFITKPKQVFTMDNTAVTGFKSDSQVFILVAVLQPKYIG